MQTLKPQKFAAKS